MLKKIGVEEHFTTQDYIDYLRTRQEYPKRDYIEKDGKRLERDWYTATNYRLIDPTTPDKTLDLGEGRLKDMDEAGIDMQVISFVAPNIGWFSAADGTSLARKINDELTTAVRKHPKRFAGLAHVAVQDPAAASDELERAVKKLGLKGLAISGTIGDEYLDDQKYWPIFESAEKLDVPIYFHPGPPSNDIINPYLAYPGLSGAMLGYAAGTSLHAMRLISSGVFDKYPNLKIILGHLGESLPYWLWRMDRHWHDTPLSQQLKKTPSEYIKDNFYVTLSGMFWLPPLICAYLALGADKILFAVDYPYESSQDAVQFIESAPISDCDKEKICHLNAEKLFRL